MRSGQARPRFYAWGNAVAVLLLVSWPLYAQQEQKNPPLWQLTPFDRLVLADDSVHDIDPVRIPDDVTFKAAVDRPVASRPGPEKEIIVHENKYVGIPGIPKPDVLKGEIRGGLFRIRRLADGLDYYVSGRSIRRITFYEDLLLAEANEHIRSRQFEEAIPYLETVHARNPNWPGLLQARLRLHVAEAEQFALHSDYLLAFESYRTAFNLAQGAPEDQRNQQTSPDAIREKLEEVTRTWVESLLISQQFEEGRRVVARLELLFPQSAVAREAREKFARRTEELLAEMNRLMQAGDMVMAQRILEQAKGVDPSLPALREQAEKFYSTFPVLRVAVEQLARFHRGPADWSVADWRCADLVHLPLLKLTTTAEESKPFESPIIQSLEQSNINKRATVTIRDSIRWPDDKPVTAMDVLRLLVHSCREQSPLYHPGMARLVTGMHPEYPNALHIDFDRPQFRPAAWLQMPMIRLGGTVGGRRFTTAQGLGPFRLESLKSDGKQTVFLANPLYHEENRPILQEIVELKIPSSADRLRALEKREVDLVAYVPPRHVEAAKQLSGVRVIERHSPTIYVLQFDFNRPILRDRTLRRAIDYAIDREAIFRAVQVQPDEKNRIITAPLPYGSFGYKTQVQARSQNNLLAKAVIFGLRKKHGSLPRLTLSHAGNETTRKACEMIAEMLVEVGLDVIVVDRQSDFSRDHAGDLRLETYNVQEPIYHLITLLTRENPSLLPHTTPWLRQQLIELQNIPHFTAAKELLPALHQTLHEDVACLPLWQWHDHLAVSDAVSNLPEEFTQVYERVSEWSVEPSYPPSYWQAPALAKNAAAPQATMRVAARGATN